MFIDLLLVIAALVVLTAGAELLVRGAVEVARAMGVSSFFIGLTIVGFGTSTPELSTSIMASLKGQSDLAVGNVIGSNIFNIAVILGFAALICPIPVRVAAVRREAWLGAVVALIPFTAMLTGDQLPRWMGALLVCVLIGTLVLAYRAGRSEHESQLRQELEAEIALPPVEQRPRVSVLSLVQIIVGLALLVGGSRLLMGAAVSLAQGFGVSELVIGLTIVAAGTSMPELLTSIVAAIRRQPDIAVGNVLGSNLFNVLGILGLTSLIVPQSIDRQIYVLDGPVLLLASVGLLPIMASASRISRIEGVVLLAGYCGYVVILILLA